MPYKVPMGATPAGSYTASLDTTLKGTSDWTLTDSINSCQTYYCTFECDVTRVLTNSDVNDVQFTPGALRNWQVGYKVYNKSIIASGLQNTASAFTAIA